MKPIIGIINKSWVLPSGNKILYSYKEIVNKIIKSNGIPIGINIENINIKEILNITDGIILQGGDDYTEKEEELIKYAYEKDIPLLGICLGMQTMALALGGKLEEINNHMKPNNNSHEVYLKKHSKIFKILNKEKIIVNSRHNFAVKNTNLDITGYSNDNVIEVIEDKNKKFFIGIQWHPESLENEDSKKLFDYFVNTKGEL